jgi:lipopolysaccharide heptosyltransferase I
VPDEERLLIVRLSAAGDVVHALPVARALRRARPDLRLHWLVEDRFAGLLRGNPDLEAVLELPRRAWRGTSLRRKAGDLRGLAGRLRGAGYAATLDLQGLTKSALAARLSGAPLRIGFAAGEGRRGVGGGRELSPWLNNRLVETAATHVVDRNLALLQPLGLADPAVAFPAPPPPDGRIADFLSRCDPQGRGVVALHPGAGWAAKRWPEDRWQALAAELAAATARPLVVTWGGPAEQKMAAGIVQRAGESCMMAPETDLPQLWSLLARAALCVGGDTGPLHMAAAAGVPCVALFGPTDGQRNGPYGAGHTVLQGRCANHPRCWRRRWRSRCRCLRTLEVEAVRAACIARLTESA